MRRSLGSLGVLAALGCVAPACAPCADSADIQVSLDVDERLGAEVARLEVGVTPAGGARQVMPVPTPGGLRGGRTILLSPSSVPSGDSYTIAVDITARRSDDVVLAAGKADIEAGTRACNRRSLALVGPASGDLAGEDLAGVDEAGGDLVDAARGDLGPGDLASVDARVCTPSSPDEDGDGIADDCDVCAADADPSPIPTDTDGDGLPDVCDPNNDVNKRLYFEPFNGPLVGWTGSPTPTGGSELALSSSSLVSSTFDTSVAFSPNLRVQTRFSIASATAGASTTVRTYLWKNGPVTAYSCRVRLGASGTHYLELLDAGATTPVGVALPTPLAIGTRYRMWMFAQSSRTPNFVGCDLRQEDGTSLAAIKSETVFSSTDVVGVGIGVGLELGSAAGSIEARFHSVFAATYLP